MNCISCGSDKLIEGLKIISDSEFRKPPKVEILEKPNSFLKVPKQFSTYANVCGNCGKVDFMVEDPHKLWESYQKSLENQ